MNELLVLENFGVNFANKVISASQNVDKVTKGQNECFYFLKFFSFALQSPLKILNDDIRRPHM